MQEADGGGSAGPDLLIAFESSLSREEELAFMEDVRRAAALRGRTVAFRRAV